MKLHIMTYDITSFTTRKIFTMNCTNTSLKYQKEFKQIYSCIFYLKRCKKSFKLQRKFTECMHIADEKPIQPFFHLSTSNRCQNSGNSTSMRWILEHKLKRLEQIKHIPLFHEMCHQIINWCPRWLDCARVNFFFSHRYFKYFLQSETGL